MSENINELFSELYDKYIAKIYRYIFLKVVSKEIAEDLASEVFLRAFKSMKKPGFKLEHPQAFFYQIARNVVADHYRSKKIKTVPLETAEFTIADDKDSTFEKSNISLEMDKIKKALVFLNGDYQDLIILRYIDELANGEIAEITGKSEEAVRVGVFRALQSLKEKLGDYYGIT